MFGRPIASLPGTGPRSHAFTSVPSAAFSPGADLGQIPITVNPSVHVWVAHRSSRRECLTCSPVFPS